MKCKETVTIEKEIWESTKNKVESLTSLLKQARSSIESLSDLLRRAKEKLDSINPDPDDGTTDISELIFCIECELGEKQ